MKILVTGALGHIGSRLIRELPGMFPEAEISMVDNMLTQRYCSLFDLPAHGRYSFVEADVLTCDLAALLKDVDVVIHLAAITDAASSFDKKELVEEVNYSATERLATACAETGSALIFLSTTSVYGTQEEMVDENCTAEELKPQSPYAESKLRAERMLARLGEQGLRFIVLRFGTIFGISPGMRFHTAVNKFVWQACMGEPITVWRTALHQRRPYLDLGDAIRALGFVIKGNRFDNQVYNVLTTNATVHEIAESIRAEMPALEIKLVDAAIMNQLSYHVRSEKFEKLGFSFSGSLAAGISATSQLLKPMNSGKRR
jgi:UDP-glucose 4-epimerase